MKASKGESIMLNILQSYLKQFNIRLLEEVRTRGYRYDFYIPTKPCIVIELDGSQHKNYTEFFHKNFDNFIKSRERDKLKDIETDIMIRIDYDIFLKDNFIILDELKKYKNILKLGENKNDEFIIRQERKREYKTRVKHTKKKYIRTKSKMEKIFESEFGNGGRY